MKYMKQLTSNNYEVMTPLGEWIHQTHRQWEWMMDENQWKLCRRHDAGWLVYVKRSEVWVRDGVTKVEPVGDSVSVKLSETGGVVVGTKVSMQQ